jgi:hypothetical protein
MHILKYAFLFFLTLLLVLISPINANAQDTSRLRISLLTCSPGEELYSIFGHSAIRIIDSNNVTDYVYNFGTFNFEDNGFYLKFIRGKLMYFVSIERVDDFVYSYMAEGRSIVEQVLNLSPQEKYAIKKSLIENLKEENKYYKYDFFLDNCTTRLRDIITKYNQKKILLPAVMPQDTRFRQAIHQYLDKSGQYWSKLGIDILLGSRTDKIMTDAEQEFLPDNLMKSLDSCTNQHLIQSKSSLFEATDLNNNKNWFTPIICFSLFSLIIFLISLMKNKISTIIMDEFDRIFFFVIGMLGILLVLMWVATDHSMTKNNFNLLWALPTHIYTSFIIKRTSSFVKYYYFCNFILVLMILTSWFMLPQEMNNALLPLVVLIGYRLFYRYKKLNALQEN